ncbi:MAG: UvrD-helicase domain-containing protein [Terracidiphilus sp.]
MNKPADQTQRDLALDPSRSILVQAPAGSGKTTLLTERFLRLLAEVDEPGQVVAITFTNAAAAEMRNRILDELRGAEPSSLARRALEHSQALGWKLLDQPAQLRICTIDSFCRELAVQQPLLSGLGGALEIAEQPRELYRRAARETLRKIDQNGSALSAAIEDLLLWRDNGWAEMEALLIEMLANRDRWMHNFVLEREPDWSALRERLERPFACAVAQALDALSRLLDQAPGARDEALALARFACALSGGLLHRELAEVAELPSAPFMDLEEARSAHTALGSLLLTGDGSFRKAIDKRLGFPADRKREKARLVELIAALATVPGLESALAAVHALPPARYTEDDWRIVRACFTLLRHAAGELQIAFAEAGRADFIEVAQVAQRVLRGEDGLPTDAAFALSDGIRHLLIDEFQDTSRKQHELLRSLVAAWPERTGRTCFVVGDPMQSIYSFRDADAELFERVKTFGLEIPHEEPQRFDFAELTANFRTAPSLVARLNQAFTQIFAADDGSRIRFSAAQPARQEAADAAPTFALHLEFVPQAARGSSADTDEKEAARARQMDEIIALIRSHASRMEAAKASGQKFRIAVLGRARSALAPIAAALRAAEIPFRAVDLENLSDRPEVLDALALACALLNPLDRVAWLGLLRAPWCGFSLQELHTLAGDGAAELLSRPVPELLAERLNLLSEASRPAAARLLEAIATAAQLRATQPAFKLGSRLEQVWLQLGGAACVDASARANLDLLWSCLDRLPGGEEDLLGPALGAALDRLTALPDPAASSECGVQLMTIHKAKGLEFEVVVVPELQAATGRGGYKMLSWLERGLAEPDESGEITEFLIAPFQRKGEERGSAKAWVDQVYRLRESRETRRILYVAATRAREELHLFARPACKEQNGELALVEPSNSLLATAWPALEEEVRARFEEWKASRPVEETHEDQIESIAAAGDLLVMPSPIRPTLLRRLPADFSMSIGVRSIPPFPLKNAERMGHPPVNYTSHQSVILSEHGESKDLRFGFAENVRIPRTAGAPGLDFETGERSLYPRHEGGLLSRALGTVVHALLEELARLRATLDWEAARLALLGFEPRIMAQVRAVGVDPAQAARISAEALQLALAASLDPTGAWILSPHKSAASETAWAGVVGGSVRAVRVDRVFQAGPAPCSEEGDCWWIIDYKTAHGGELDLAALRSLFTPQMEAYAQLLRNQIGDEPDLFAGLYYPRMKTLDWWQL